MTRERIIAVLLAPKKIAKLPLNDICSLSGHKLIIMTRENWRNTLCSGLIIDILIHKLADFFLDPSSSHYQTPSFEGYRELVSNLVEVGTIVRVVDGFDGMDMLQSRLSMLRSMERLIVGLPVAVPSWSPRLMQGKFVIAKPIDACGAPNSHLMQLMTLPCAESWKALEHDHVFQTFIPHHETLYKLYVVGKHVDVVVRSSISDSIFTSHGEFEYGVTVGKAQVLDSAALGVAMDRLSPHMPALVEFINRMRCSYQLTLFGVDVLLGEDTMCTPHIIDINYFPGFDGVPELSRKLADAVIN